MLPQPFVDELRLWSKLRHSNILPLIGDLLEGNYPSIVSEWMENGNLKSYLQRKPDADRSRLVSNFHHTRGLTHREQNKVHGYMRRIVLHTHKGNGKVFWHALFES